MTNFPRTSRFLSAYSARATAIGLVLSLLAVPLLAQESKEPRTHLFILSGQSNMVRLNPKVSFEPALKKSLAGDTIIVVHDALGAQPISRWYKDWKSTTGERPEVVGDLYDRLMNKVKPAIEGKRIDTITFVWMQGESDAFPLTKNLARYGEAAVYETSLRGLFGQLRKDLSRDDVNIVIGRISDHDMANKEYPRWTEVRQVQMHVADTEPRCAWIDADDLNGPDNNIHYDTEGRKVQGERFAAKAVELIAKYSTKIAPRTQPSN